MSPVKTSLEVKLDYIHQDLKDVKGDIKEMKDAYVSRREFEDKIAEIEEKLVDKVVTTEKRVDGLYKVAYGVGATIGVLLLGALMKLIVK